ncbi:MAG TPA: PspC domain-containing protein [Alphaproteobacteria bacterium]|nr:PspC domain-containing protein [Alphaproteobacteria bacterium]
MMTMRAERMSSQRFYRISARGKIAGVCAGIGQSFGVEPLWVRLAWIAALFATGPIAVVTYLILAWALDDHGPAGRAEPGWTGAAAAGPAAGDAPDDTAALAEQLRRLEARAAALERIVTSKDWKLRQELERLRD